jgi:uncharacterized protein
MSEILSNQKPSGQSSKNRDAKSVAPVNAMAQHIDLDPARIQAIIDLIESALRGAALVDLQRQFKQELGQVVPVEFAYAEELLLGSSLMQEGQEQNLDALIHLFRPSLLRVVYPDLPDGHPAESFRLEGEQLRMQLDEMRGHCARRKDDIDGNREWWRRALTRLRDIDIRFRRKEVLIFPRLLRKGFSRPTEIMTGYHQQLMMHLDQAVRELEYGEATAFRTIVQGMIQDFSQLLFKEEKVLCPTCLALFDSEDWEQIRLEEDRIGWAFIDAPPEWTGDPNVPLPVQEGNLSLDQLALMFDHMPFDVTYVDENDIVIYYNDRARRIHKRGPRVIGRDMRMCHRPNSRPQVDRVIQDLRSGKIKSMSFVRKTANQRVLVQYIGVYDSEGVYRGVLDISQDLGVIDQVVQESDHVEF